ERRDAEARSGFVVDVFRQSDGLRAGQRDVLCGGAERPLPLAVPDPHALADAARPDPGSHGIDIARAVAVRDHERGGELAAAAAAAGLPVRRIDARRAQPDPDFARPRLGGRTLTDFED